MIWFIVASIFDFPRIIIELLDLPIQVYLGGNPPWLIIFLALIISLNLIFIERFNKIIVPISKVDILFMAMLSLWMLLYLYHSDFLGGGWGAWYGARLITTNIWVALSLYCIVTIYKFRDIREIIILISIKSWFIFVVLFFIITIMDMINVIDLGGRNKSNNGISMILTSMVTFVLFYGMNISKHDKVLYLTSFVGFVVFAESRGAMLVLLSIFVYKLYSMYGIARRIIIIIMSATILFVLYNYSLFLYSVNEYFLGYDVFNAVIDNSEGYGKDSDNVSAISRINSSILLFKEFLSHPILGIGYNDATNVRSFGYISHTYYLFPLASYGLIGILPLVILIYYIFNIAIKKNKEFAISSMLLFMVMFTFSNDMHAWISIFIFALLYGVDLNKFNSMHIRYNALVMEKQ